MSEGPGEDQQGSWDPARTTLDPQQEIQQPEFGRTTLDGEAAGPGAEPWARTTLDGADVAATTLDGSAATAGFVVHQLPPGLAADYELLARLGGGGEAVVYRARDRRGNREVALKIHVNVVPEYSFQIGDDNHRRYFPAEHCVELYERREENGVHVEVMELCREGTLADHSQGHSFDRAAIEEVVAEVAEAIHAMGTFRHGDLKPQNILVRSLDPLDLVLTDFGLTKDLGDRARMTIVGHGTRLYQPPGTGRSGRKEDDWWALGIIVAELAAGRHPFDGLSEITRSEEALRDHLINHCVPTDQITDARVRHLARGLLVRNPEERFGYEQVTQWLAGGTPELPHDAGQVVVAADPFAFQGRHYVDPKELAEAIRTNPRGFEAGQGITFRDLVEWSSRHPNHMRIRGLARRQESLPGRVIAGLLATLLAGDGRLIVDGRDLTTPEGLAELGEHPDVLNLYLERHVLARCSEVLSDPDQEAVEPGGVEGFARLDHVWWSCFDGAKELLRRPVGELTPETRRLLLVESWRMALDDSHLADVRARIEQAVATEPFLVEVDWFAALWERRAEADAVAAMLLALPTAQQRAGTLRVERAEQEERERIAAEKERVAAEERRREERARRIQQRKDRVRMMSRRLVGVFGWALAPGIIHALWYPMAQASLIGNTITWEQVLEQAKEHAVRQLLAAVVTVLICIPGARRHTFASSWVAPLHCLAIAAGFTSMAWSATALPDLGWVPWLGCLLVAVQQLLVLFLPGGERLTNVDVRDGASRLFKAMLGSGIISFVLFGLTYLGYAGTDGWTAYTSVLAGQLFYGTLLLLPVVATRWFRGWVVALLNLLPLAVIHTAQLQVTHLSGFTWAGRDCVLNLEVCHPYLLGAPSPEPHSWAIIAMAIYAALCGTRELISRHADKVKGEV